VSVNRSRVGALAGVMMVMALGASRAAAQKPGAGADTAHAAHHPAQPQNSAAAPGAAKHDHMQMHEQMMDLHMRMMSDSLIHARIMADSSMHEIMQQMMQHVTAEHREKMQGMMERMSPEHRAKMQRMMEPMPAGHDQHKEQPPAAGHRHPGN
jgi:reverse gyrase